MKCPKCQAEIHTQRIGVGDQEECGGIEVSFRCNACESNFFAILTPRTFVEAN